MPLGRPLPPRPRRAELRGSDKPKNDRFAIIEMTEQEFPDDFSGEFKKDIILALSKEQFPVIVKRNFEVRQSIDDFMEPIRDGVLEMKLQDTSDLGPAVARLEQIGKEVIAVDISAIDLDLFSGHNDKV